MLRTVLTLCLAGLFLAGAIDHAHANPGMAVAAAILSATASAAAVSAVAFVVNAAISIGLSLGASYLLAGRREVKPGSVGTQLRLQAAPNVPRTFPVGERSPTNGSLVYANSWGDIDVAGNLFLTRVIVLSDLPIPGVESTLFVDGEACPFDDDDPSVPVAPATGIGTPILKYRAPIGEFGNFDHLWVKFYDGTQTTADAYLVEQFGDDEDHPWTEDHILAGCAYMIVTARYNTEVFSGVPQVRPVLQGIPLYDPRKDTSVGGDGAHRWNNPATWEPTGNPMVVAYNILRGIYYDGEWVYGLQGTNPLRLPLADWFAAMNVCDEPIDLEAGGTEPQFVCGGEIPVDVPIIDAIEALMASCNGRINEIGGVYKPFCGPVGSSVFSFTDGDIITDDPQTFLPQKSLADTVNGISATYREPVEAFNQKPAPDLFRPDLEVLDGGRRLVASVAYDFVHSGTQAQRLMKSALEEHRKSRRHTITLPPDAYVLEPGDIVDWTSTVNGYNEKLFRVERPGVLSGLNVSLDILECDPADYDWEPGDDERPIIKTPIVPVRPPHLLGTGFAFSGVVIEGDAGEKLAAIQVDWTPAAGFDVDAVLLQWRRPGSPPTDLQDGRTDDVGSGRAYITSGIQSLTDYEVRARYRPSSRKRKANWSDWEPVTTPDARVDLTSLDPNLKVLLDQLRIEAQAFLRGAIDEKADWLRRLSAVSTDVQAGLSVTEDRIMAAVVKRTAEASAVAIRLQQAIVEEGLARAEITDFVQAELASLGGQVTGLAAGMQTLVAQVSDIDGTLTALVEAATVLQGRVDNLETNQSGIASALDLLTVRVDSNEGGIVALAQRTTTLETIVNHGATGNAALAVAVQQLTTRVTATENGLTAQAALIAGLQSQINLTNANVTGLANAFQSLETRVEVVEGAVTVEAIRKSLLDSQYLQFQPIKVWKGRTAIQNKGTPINGSFSNAQHDTTRLTASGGSPAYRFNFETGDYFGGNGNRTVRVVGRWVGAGHDYLGRLNYRTTSHGYVGNFRKDAAHPWGSGNAIPGQLVALSFDMTNVDGGGNPADWRQNTITGLQFSPSLSSSAVFELWWIGWGSEVLSAYSAVVETDSAVTKKNDDGLTTMASSLKGLISETEYGYAEGLINFETISGPVTVQSRALIQVRASNTQSYTEASFALDTMAGGKSRVIVAADQFVLTDKTLRRFNNDPDPDPVFEVVGGTVYIKKAHIRELTADNFEIDALSAPISGGITQNWRPPGQVQYGTWYNTPLSAQAKLTGQNRFYFVFLNVQGALTGLGSDTAYVSFRLMRGGSQVRLWNNVASQTGNNVLNFSADLYSLEHQPVGTPQTYTLQVRWTRSSGSGNVLASTNVGAGTRFIGFGNAR